MMRRVSLLVRAAGLAVLLLICGRPGPALAQAITPAITPAITQAIGGSGAGGPVILVSIDGFRADYLQRGHTPVLTRLAAQGVTAVMRPSFPALTFPNHYTLVTGLRPDHHGITDNIMEDPTIPPGRFSVGSPSVTERRWWDDAEPLWVTADRQGVKTATLFWPGSEADIHGSRPDLWLGYDPHMSAGARVDQVLAWLDLPAAARPGFITLYFDQVDTAGHMGGPNSAELDMALEGVDAAIGRLVEGLRARGMWDRGLLDRANLIIVADHGMAAISPERVVVLDDFVDLAHVHVVTAASNAGLAPDANLSQAALARILAPHPHARCWKKADIPASLHYGAHRRIPPIFCAAEVGWQLSTRERAGRIRTGGAHGYNPEAPEMAALFIASGPAFTPGRVLSPFDNVDVYPLLARLLHLRVPPGDGRSDTFDTVLTVAH